MTSLNEEKRWKDIDSVLLRKGPYTPEEFEPSEELKQTFFEYARILVVGAGGLGCEILKDLALVGFKNIDVIDLDKIDITNLNRQFLFRQSDVGSYKSEVAARFIEKRVPGCKVTAHVGKIQDKPKEFYEEFQVIIAGLDNIEARRWLNQTIHSLVEFENGEPKPETVRPLIDGGTEGFKGQARVIMPFKTACFECTLNTISKNTVYNFCTIAQTPRIAEHCIAYAQLILWEEKFPDRKIDTDSVEDMTWLFERAQARAAEFGISGVTFKLTQGVVKNIIPAIASTNALIAAACSNEAFKLMTGCSKTVDNYMMYMGQDGIYTNVIKYEPQFNCPICVGMRPKKINFNKEAKLREFIDHLKNSKDFKFERPSVRTLGSGVLYLANPNFEHMYLSNLEKTMQELKIQEGTDSLELIVQDASAELPIRFEVDLQ